MKLELRHLAPYLPYGLKAINKDDSQMTITGCLDKHTVVVINKGEFKGYDLKYIKPILRPLSSITDMDIYNIDSLIYDDVEICFSLKDGLCVRADGNYGWCHTPSLGIDGINKISEYLFKNHFDVFGLINKGLAVEKR